MTFHVNLTTFAVVLWSGMLIISGSIWVLSSQVRKLVDVIEDQGKARLREARSGRNAMASPRPIVHRKAVNVRRVVNAGRAATARGLN
jgi:hypothetical protein